MNFMQEKIKRLDVIDADQLATLIKKNGNILIQYYFFYNSLSVKFKSEEDEDYKIYCNFHRKYRINNFDVNGLIKDYIIIIPINENYFLRFYCSVHNDYLLTVSLWQRNSYVSHIYQFLNLAYKRKTFINEILQKRLDDVNDFYDFNSFSDYFDDVLNVVNARMLLFKLSRSYKEGKTL